MSPLRPSFGRPRSTFLAGTLAVACMLLPASALGSPYVAYVADRGAESLTPLSLQTGLAGAPIKVGSEPWGVAITPDGRTAYVTDYGAKAVTPVNLATGTAGTPIPVGEGPDEIAITPDGRTAYVCDYTSDAVTPIDLATGVAGTPIQVGTTPINIAITPDGQTAYVVNAGSNNVTPIDLETNTAGTPIAAGEGPTGISITPDGRTAYVSDFTTGEVVPIELASNTPGTPIPVGEHPENVAVSPNGGTVYVASYSTGALIPINTATNQPGTPITALTDSSTLAIAPDESGAIVASIGGALAANVGFGGGSPVQVEVGTTPYQLAITPDQPPQAALTAAAAPAGQATSFDASASTPGTEPTVRYRWSFGDGVSEETAAPRTTHVYATAGTRTATVSETDAAGTSGAQVFTGQTMSLDGGPQATASLSLSVPAATAASNTSVTDRSARTARTVGTGGAARAAHVRIPARGIPLSAAGIAVVPVSCPATAEAPCRGTVTISEAGRGHAASLRATASVCARGCRRLGAAKYEARPGTTARVRVHIASFVRRTLRRGRSLGVRIVVSSVAGSSSTSATIFTTMTPQHARLRRR